MHRKKLHIELKRINEYDWINFGRRFVYVILSVILFRYLLFSNIFDIKKREISEITKIKPKHCFGGNIVFLIEKVRVTSKI